jgi:hypothetical protein
MTPKTLLAGWVVSCCLLVPAAIATGDVAAPFTHPGILNGKAELALVKAKVAAGEQPWKDAFERAKALPIASLDYEPKPHEEVNCGSGSRPNFGCSDEKRDSQSAYLHALLWAVGGDERHARKSAEILKAWCILKSHGMSNANLQAGWTGGPFCRAAEILRHTDSPTWTWPKEEQDAFTEMLRRAFVPRVGEPQRPSTNGNWEAVMIETAMSIAVFTDDRALFDKCVVRYKKRLPAFIYGVEDGPVPLTVDAAHYDTREKIDKHWHGQTVLFDGLSQETGRDLTHTQWGIGALVHCAEIAWHQGIDLYAENGNRILRGMEFHAKYLNGAPVPQELQGGKLDGGRIVPTWEIAYNHYHGRRGLPMPETEKLLAKHRPEMGPDHHLGFGTLSHYGTGAATAATPAKP